MLLTREGVAKIADVGLAITADYFSAGSATGTFRCMRFRSISSHNVNLRPSWQDAKLRQLCAGIACFVPTQYRVQADLYVLLRCAAMRRRSC